MLVGHFESPEPCHGTDRLYIEIFVVEFRNTSESFMTVRETLTKMNEISILPSMHLASMTAWWSEVRSSAAPSMSKIVQSLMNDQQRS